MNQSEDIASKSCEDATNVAEAATTSSETDLPGPKKRKTASGFFIGLSVGIVATLVLGSVLWMILIKVTISKYRNQNVTAQTSEAITGTEATSSDQSEILTDETIRQILSIQDIFDEYSVYDVPKDEMRRSMIDGLVAGSGDRYAMYYTAEEFDELLQDYEGTFYGIGAHLYLDEDTGYGTINDVIEGSPAQSSGLQAFDVIVEVDGESAYGLTLDELVSKVRGEKDTDVVLTIYREGESDYLYITVTRDEIAFSTVEYEMLDNRIGYIQISSFDEVTAGQFREALDAVKAQNAEGLIIDLRANGGGLLQVVCEMCRELLPEGLIVYTEDKVGNRQEEKCDGTKEINIPIVMLVNGYTASASEIMTGALQDHGKAVIMGTTTYGKGVVQGFRRMTDGSVLKLTTEKYYTPLGRTIDGTGIEPDVVVEFDAQAYYYGEDHYDNQKDEAYRYLLEQLGTK